MKKKFIMFALVILLAASVLTSCDEISLIRPARNHKEISRFSSGEELVAAFQKSDDIGVIRGALGADVMKSMEVAESAPQAAKADSGRDYSETNIQVKGVDEADIIKTDGSYIYTIAQGSLVIAKAYPSSQAEILSTTNIKNFYPKELFIHDDRLLIFGSVSYSFEEEVGRPVENIRPYPRYVSVMSARLYDISDKKKPELLRTVDFEGSYLTSRKIEDDVYFVVNSYPHFYRENPPCEEIIPLYRESKENELPSIEDMVPVARCVDIGYIEPIQARNFITIASISMTEKNKKVEKEVIVGSGQNVYASLDNLYIAQTSWPRYNSLGNLKEDYFEKTVVTKFSLDDGKVHYSGTGDVKGHILNQFSMDEFNNNLRIATTSGEVWNSDRKSGNNVYVLDQNLNVIGELEDLAPGEKIYSVRFMGRKGYVVTFKKVDPLFVIDLSNPYSPEVLGKLKIPGYSDYLHPYDETHIIGIGKDTVEAEEEPRGQAPVDFAWYQGIKMAIFDVSDVENPVEMHKIVIGDRGTDSPALHDHKAFLFDKAKKLLVIPITLAEIKGEKTRDNQYGDYVFQGAYVYDLTLEEGFELKGRVTHYDDDDVFKKSGYYFSGDSSIKRSLYIEDVLYTLSNTRLQLNDLSNLERLKVLEFEEGKNNRDEPVLMR